MIVNIGMAHDTAIDSLHDAWSKKQRCENNKRGNDHECGDVLDQIESEGYDHALLCPDIEWILEILEMRETLCVCVCS